MADMKITLDEIESAENGIKRIRVILQTIGREIYKIREGKELGPEFGFESYSVENFEGSNYYGQEGPNWGSGTPIVSLRYYWPRGEFGHCVTLPLGWTDQDWRALETERVTAEKAEASRVAEEERVARAEARKRSERETYERLRAKFEGA